jgi:hypothetical protein
VGFDPEACRREDGRSFSDRIFGSGGEPSTGSLRNVGVGWTDGEWRGVQGKMLTAKLLERASYYCIMCPSVHGHHATPRLDQLMTDTGHPQLPATLDCTNMKRFCQKPTLHL